MATNPVSQPTIKRPEDENLGLTANIAYGFQHVLTMYGGIIAVPLIVGQAAGLGAAEIGLLIAASLFIGGVATLIQTLGVPFFGCQLPLVQGVSFASVATIVAIVTSGGGVASCFWCGYCRLYPWADYISCLFHDYQVFPAPSHRRGYHDDWFDFDARCRPLVYGWQ